MHVKKVIPGLEDIELRFRQRGLRRPDATAGRAFRHRKNDRPCDAGRTFMNVRCGPDDAGSDQRCLHHARRRIDKHDATGGGGA